MTQDGKSAPDYAGRSGAHTPGPWFYGISYEPERGPVPFDYESPGYYENSGILAADGTTVVGCGEYTIFNSPEDVRLMVAAPDMLEALKTTAGNIRSLGPAGALTRIPMEYREWLAVVDAAIAKAEGSQP